MELSWPMNSPSPVDGEGTWAPKPRHGSRGDEWTTAREGAPPACKTHYASFFAFGFFAFAFGFLPSNMDTSKPAFFKLSRDAPPLMSSKSAPFFAPLAGAALALAAGFF